MRICQGGGHSCGGSTVIPSRLLAKPLELTWILLAPDDATAVYEPPPLVTTLVLSLVPQKVVEFVVMSETNVVLALPTMIMKVPSAW
jgi:hypothetical protein